MHELSIAKSLVEQVGRHMPAGATLRAARVRVGPMRAIEPGAMDLAWRAVTLSTAYDGARLDLEEAPGGDELMLMSLDVEESNDKEGVAP